MEKTKQSGLAFKEKKNDLFVDFTCVSPLVNEKAPSKVKL